MTEERELLGKVLRARYDLKRENVRLKDELALALEYASALATIREKCRVFDTAEAAKIVSLVGEIARVALGKE